MPPTNKYLSVGGRAAPAPAPMANPEPCGVLQASASMTNNGGGVNAVFADLTYAFNRHEAQVRSYRADRDQELDDAVDD